MAKPYFFIFEEHSEQLNQEVKTLSSFYKKSFDVFNLPESYFKYMGVNSQLKADYLIGMRWIESLDSESNEKGVLWVKPKHTNIPFEKILWICLNHPIVGNHMEECYKIFPDEPSIPIDIDFDDFITPLLITDFLVRVKKIAQKGLKKNFVTVQQTLRNKIKGKILVIQTIKRQLKKNTATEVDCSFQTHTVDCIENQIIKSALLLVRKYANQNIYKINIENWSIQDVLSYNLNSFAHISDITVKISDFDSVSHGSFYKDYKYVLNLAKMLFKGLGFSIQSENFSLDRTIPPFYINMPELFERYCEVLLRNKYNEDVYAGYHQFGYSETRMGQEKLRPDFELRKRKIIIDSKYKYWIDESPDKEGLKQLCLYSRHIKLKDFYSNGTIPKLQFIYPKDDGCDIIDFENEHNKLENEYIDISKYPIKLLI